MKVYTQCTHKETIELIENISNFSIYKKIWICPATNKIFPEYILKNNSFNEVLCRRRKLKGIKSFLVEKKLIKNN